MIKLLVFAIIIALFLVFAANNHDMMGIALFPLPYTMYIPKFLFAIACMAVGVIIGGFSINLRLSRSKRLYNQEHKRVVALQNEIRTLHERDSGKLTVT